MEVSEQSLAVLIPAYNEEGRIGRVVEVARQLGYVLVVDDGSSDDTAREAVLKGATVLILPENMGKFSAVREGMKRLKRFDMVLLLDADLLGLRPEHLKKLIIPVLNGICDATVGVLVKGRIATHWSNVLAPGLSGQRCFRRSMFEDFFEQMGYEGYGLEEGLNRYMKQRGIKYMFVRLDGVGQVMKEEKYGLVKGVVMRARMYVDILRAKFCDGGER